MLRTRSQRGIVHKRKLSSQTGSQGLHIATKYTLKQDRQCTYNVTLRHAPASSVAAKKKKITYSECVFVDLGIQNIMCMRHIVICGLSGSTVFLHIIS